MSKIRDTDRAKRVQQVFDFWTVALGLEGSWHVSYGFVDSINNHTSFAEVHQNMPYLKATIMFDRVCLDGSTEQELEAAIVHELMHIMLSPLGQLIKDEFGSALPTTRENFFYVFEKKGQLKCRRDERGWRVFTQDEIEGLIKTLKKEGRNFIWKV